MPLHTLTPQWHASGSCAAFCPPSPAPYTRNFFQTKFFYFGAFVLIIPLENRCLIAV
jgi:hypothetical protein